MSTDKSTLLEKLRELKEVANTSPKSADTSPTPLRTFLLIYTKAERECEMDNMEGTKALYKWLSPIEYPTYQSIEDNYKVPSLLCGYESVELAKLLINYRTADQLPDLARAERAILVTMYKEILPELY